MSEANNYENTQTNIHEYFYFHDDKYINEVIDNFNYANVHAYMTHVGWHWAHTNGVPTIELMKERNRMHIKQTIEEARNKLFNPNKKKKKKKAMVWTNTGGFDYTVWVYRGDPKPYIRLAFVITDTDNYL